MTVKLEQSSTDPEAIQLREVLQRRLQQERAHAFAGSSANLQRLPSFSISAGMSVPSGPVPRRSACTGNGTATGGCSGCPNCAGSNGSGSGSDAALFTEFLRWRAGGARATASGSALATAAATATAAAATARGSTAP